jgi:hypothetical protein
MSANEPKTLRDENSQATKILDAEYKPASLDRNLQHLVCSLKIKA